MWRDGEPLCLIAQKRRSHFPGRGNGKRSPEGGSEEVAEVSRVGDELVKKGDFRNDNGRASVSYRGARHLDDG